MLSLTNTEIYDFFPMLKYFLKLFHLYVPIDTWYLLLNSSAIESYPGHPGPSCLQNCFLGSHPSASSPLLKVFIPPQIQNFAFPCTKLLLRFLFSHFHHCIKSICFQFPGRDTASVLWRNMCFVFTGYWFWHLFISCSALTVHKCFDSKPDPQIYFKPLNV